MLNISTLFYTTTDGECLLSNIELDKQNKEKLNAAKNEIRHLLKKELPKALFEIAGEGAVAIPRFFIQGSWAYKTLNNPAQDPQQADLDDGAYLPLSFISDLEKPSIASDIYFKAVEAVLTPLVESNNDWELLINKDTCVRVEINDKSHIDIPLYAIPDKEFEKLTKNAEARFMSLDEAVMKAEQDAWFALPKNLVLLAHRVEGWKASDPRLIKDWFIDKVEEHGEQLRRVVRYLKAYRDHQWKKGGPSSILLMVATESVFEKRDRRDDMALLDVVRKLPDVLRGGVENPTDTNESLTDRITPEEIEQIAKQYESLCKHLSGSLQAADKHQANIWMCNQFGYRFPNDPGRIQSVSAIDSIKSAAPLYTSSKLNSSSTAG